MAAETPLKIVGGKISEFASTDAVSADGIAPRSGSLLTLGDAATTEVVLLQGAVQVSALVGTVDPSAGAGVAANTGSTYYRNGAAGELWLKTGAANTEWTQVLTTATVHKGTATLDFGTPTPMLVTDSFSAGPTQTLSVAGAFATRDVGRYIRISGATSAGNNGLFTILSVVPGVSCTYTNAAAVSEAALVTTTYFIPVGTNIVSVAVTGQADILSTNQAQAFFMLDSTATHNSYEHMVAPIAVSLPCGVPVNGVGFTIYGVTELRLTGTFLVHWFWT